MPLSGKFYGPKWKAALVCDAPGCKAGPKGGPSRASWTSVSYADACSAARAQGWRLLLTQSFCKGCAK